MGWIKTVQVGAMGMRHDTFWQVYSPSPVDAHQAKQMKRAMQVSDDRQSLSEPFESTRSVVEELAVLG